MSLEKDFLLLSIECRVAFAPPCMYCLMISILINSELEIMCTNVVMT